MTKGIPFPLSLPKEPTTLDSMTAEEFNSIMERGLAQANPISHALLLMYLRI